MFRADQNCRGQRETALASSSPVVVNKRCSCCPLSVVLCLFASIQSFDPCGPPVVYFVGCYCGDHEGLPFTWSLSVARAFQTIRARQRTIDLRAALLVSLPDMADGFHFVCYSPFWRSPFRGRRPLLPSGQLLFLARIGLFREGSHVFHRSLLFFFLYLRQARPAHSFFALSISPPLVPPPTKKHYEPCCLLSPRRLS